MEGWKRKVWRKKRKVAEEERVVRVIIILITDKTCSILSAKIGRQTDDERKRNKSNNKCVLACTCIFIFVLLFVIYSSFTSFSLSTPPPLHLLPLRPSTPPEMANEVASLLKTALHSSSGASFPRHAAGSRNAANSAHSARSAHAADSRDAANSVYAARA